MAFNGKKMSVHTAMRLRNESRSRNLGDYAARKLTGAVVDKGTLRLQGAAATVGHPITKCPPSKRKGFRKTNLRLG